MPPTEFKLLFFLIPLSLLFSSSSFLFYIVFLLSSFFTIWSFNLVLNIWLQEKEPITYFNENNFLLLWHVCDSYGGRFVPAVVIESSIVTLKKKVFPLASKWADMHDMTVRSPHSTTPNTRGIHLSLVLEPVTSPGEHRRRLNGRYPIHLATLYK